METAFDFIARALEIWQIQLYDVRTGCFCNLLEIHGWKCISLFVYAYYICKKK